MGIIVLTGESCGGKDTIRKELELLGYKNIVSYTSRPMREGEIDGVDYHFVTREEFQRMIDNDEMLEYRSYNTLLNGVSDTWFYGLKKETLDERQAYVVILDLEGAKNFYDYYNYNIQCHIIKLCVPYSIRLIRAENRGSFDITEWQRRFNADEIDFGFSKMFEFEKFRKVWYIDNSRQGEKYIKEIASVIDLINQKILR